MLNELKTLLRHLSSLGPVTGLKWHLIRSADSRGFLTRDTVSIRPKQLQFPIAARTKGSSDLEVFEEVFVQRETDFLALLNGQPTPELIFDLGANVGYTSAVFLNAFPNSFVLAVEPDPRNAEMCKLNLSPYEPRVRVVQGAVWHTQGRLVLSRGTFGDGREWATEVRSAGPGEDADVVAWDIRSLLELCPANRDIDLLKIDIEGSETALFSVSADDWLPRVRNICVEIHGADGHLAVLTALKNYDFKYMRYGQYTLCLDLKRKGTEGQVMRYLT